MVSADGFEALRMALDRAHIRYAVGGSWASTAYGEPRLTNDVDILAELTSQNLSAFLNALPDSFYFDTEDAATALRSGKPFNVIHMPTAFKFDLFAASAFPLGTDELDRAVFLANTGLSKDAVPFVTPEDIVLAKLHWFRLGGEVSSVQWRDIEGIVRGRQDELDRDYLLRGAAKTGVSDLLLRLWEEN